MKYRTKLYISLVSVAFVSIILGLVIFSIESEKLLLRTLRSRSLTVAATAAVELDPTLIKKTNKAIPINDPSYVTVKKILLRILKANQRDDIYITDIYTLYPDPNNPKQLLYGVEAATDPDFPGSPYQDSDAPLIIKSLNDYFVDPTYVTDPWGTWMSAYAPIKDENGDYIATIGVDINSADIHMRLEELIKFALLGLSAALILSLLIAFFLSKKVTESLDHLSNCVKEIEKGNLNIHAKLETSDEFGALSEKIDEMCKGLLERERLKMSFARYVSKHILDKIIQTETPLKIEGERRKITVLFSDIRQFTQLAENLPPEEVVHLLNEYFEQMIEVIFSQNGTLDKFIGDGVMAEFGAPLDDDEQEEHAVVAAIRMQKALEKLCEKWAQENRPIIQMGIGIHTGEAVVGHIGSEKRIEYTAIGDTVNVAARLEQATKILKTPILLSETTYLQVKDKFPFKDLGSMALPGRKEQIKVYAIDLEKV